MRCTGMRPTERRRGPLSSTSGASRRQPYNCHVPSTLRRRLAPRVQTIITSLELSEIPPGPAALFLLVGLPGAGKTTFAEALSRGTGAIVLESDRFRRLLFGEPVFSMRESEALFRALVSAAGSLLEGGAAVIVDATNLSESDRQPFYDLADDLELPLFIVGLDAPPAVIEQRLEERMSLADGYSYADLAVYHRMRGRVEPISRKHWRVDSSDQPAFEAALTAIAAAHRSIRGDVRTGRRAIRGGKAS
jgi:predicted kinase